ncbi:MAG: uracil-DNA glycosylase [Verrucomicrobia bacterium]|nr:uracil-DNA glycosylase [Verrucomicrobiota bacterium]
MPTQFAELLDAAITHLEDLKAHGTRFVAAAPESLAALAVTPGRPVAAPAARSFSPSAPAPAPSRPAVAAVRAPQSLAPLPPPLDRAAKEVAMADLRQRALACVKCPNLVTTRANVVFGVGDIHAQLMFVGEAPGADEDRAGEPFVGAAGQLLTKIIQTMGLSRDSVYIANILKCRPDTPPHATGNRKPTPVEMDTCKPWLMEQFDLIQPRVIVALGATAVEGLLGLTGITRLRGKWQTFRGVPVMPTFHPSYLLRTQALADKRRVWEDMLAVMEKLAMPINERQRGFFLKGS